jgi:hypothetical protein
LTPYGPSADEKTEKVAAPSDAAKADEKPAEKPTKKK